MNLTGDTMSGALVAPAVQTPLLRSGGASPRIDVLEQIDKGFHEVRIHGGGAHLDFYVDAEAAYVATLGAGITNFEIGATSGAVLRFLTNGTSRWEINGTVVGEAGTLLPHVDNSHDIGTAAFRVRNIFVGTAPTDRTTPLTRRMLTPT